MKNNLLFFLGIIAALTNVLIYAVDIPKSTIFLEDFETKTLVSKTQEKFPRTKEIFFLSGISKIYPHYYIYSLLFFIFYRVLLLKVLLPIIPI